VIKVTNSHIFVINKWYYLNCVLYECKTWFSCFERRTYHLHVFENKMLMKIFQSKNGGIVGNLGEMRNFMTYIGYLELLEQ
jgi:hypothetical protein